MRFHRMKELFIKFEERIYCHNQTRKKKYGTVTYNFVVEVCKFPFGHFTSVLLLLLSPVLVVLVEKVHPRQCQHHKWLHKR